MLNSRQRFRYEDTENTIDPPSHEASEDRQLTRTEQEVTMESRMKSGQILILVLLIVVVSLAVGLSVASRNLTNLRISTQTEESQRAFSAAEGGVEDVLSRLNAISLEPAVLDPAGYTLPSIRVGDEIDATVNVKCRNVYETTVPLGEVAQITLINPGPPESYYSGTLSVEWLKTGEEEAAIELTLICDTSTNAANCLSTTADQKSTTYSQNRFAFMSNAISGLTGFRDCVTASPAPPCSGATAPYQYKISLDLTNANNKARILRIKPFYKPVSVLISGSANPLPTQINEIIFQAKRKLGITRKVQVTRTALPALPAIFDYVLYSEGDIVK